MAGDKCEVKRCRRSVLLIYSAFGPRRNKDVSVCEYHWGKHCDEGDAFDLRSYFYPKSKKERRDGEG